MYRKKCFKGNRERERERDRGNSLERRNQGNKWDSSSFSCRLFFFYFSVSTGWGEGRRKKKWTRDEGSIEWKGKTKEREDEWGRKAIKSKWMGPSMLRWAFFGAPLRNNVQWHNRMNDATKAGAATQEWAWRRETDAQKETQTHRHTDREEESKKGGKRNCIDRWRLTLMAILVLSCINTTLFCMHIQSRW